ncbi:MAG: ABC transporter ATP-binding protein [Pseudomonadota bacterium]
MSEMVKVSNLTRVFDVSKPWLNRLLERLPRSTLTAVNQVSFTIKEGEVYGLVGESGSGKSTIGKMIVGLLPPSDGEITVEGTNLFTEADEATLDRVKSDIQMIFQDPFASLNPRWRVRHIIVEPLSTRGIDTTGVAEKMLKQVGLTASDADKFPHEFSGGQRQRICIARALASEPRLIVCDEPTSALDVSVQAQVLNLMNDLQEQYKLTYLLISHDLTVVRHMSDRIGVLYLGQLVEEAAAEELFHNPQHPYTQMLLEAAPRIDGFGREVTPPEGEIPDPINPPSGCVFHPRCPKAQDRCIKEVPQTREVSQSRVMCHFA